MTPADPDLADARRLRTDVLEPLKREFVGKDEITDLLGIALVAGENLFLLGPPGTAKSAIVGALAARFDGRVFDYLLTRFTEPGELFGPFDIRKLKDGELVTNTEGMLPEAELVFLDELTNANSAILNGLLTALNERVFRRGRETRKLPTLMCVGASNRLPEDEALGALFDRFLLRVRCDNVPPDDLAAVLDAGWRRESPTTTPPRAMRAADIRRLGARIATIDVASVRAEYVALVGRIRRAGIAVSDRRAVKLQRLVAASALLCGRLRAMRSDLWVLRYIWDREEEIERLAAIVLEATQDLPPNEAALAHPRALGGARPDPELLAEELAAIDEALLRDGTDPAEHARLADRLGLLASRVAWVVEDEQRAWLETQLAEVWARAGSDG